MAGGPLAAEVACLSCLGDRRVTRAVRVYEGIEDDHYRCERGHQFGIDWSRGQPEQPQWPPPPDLVAALTGRSE